MQRMMLGPFGLAPAVAARSRATIAPSAMLRVVRERPSGTEGWRAGGLGAEDLLSARAVGWIWMS